MLFHDAQYNDHEYPHHVGWGHSCVAHALAFARVTGWAAQIVWSTPSPGLAIGRWVEMVSQ